MRKNGYANSGARIAISCTYTISYAAPNVFCIKSANDGIFTIFIFFGFSTGLEVAARNFHAFHSILMHASPRPRLLSSVHSIYPVVSSTTPPFSCIIIVNKGPIIHRSHAAPFYSRKNNGRGLILPKNPRVIPPKKNKYPIPNEWLARVNVASPLSLYTYIPYLYIICTYIPTINLSEIHDEHLRTFELYLVATNRANGPLRREKINTRYGRTRISGKKISVFVFFPLLKKLSTVGDDARWQGSCQMNRRYVREN